MPESSHPQSLLPLPAPPPGDLRIVLVILRRMAGHGLQDGRAVMLALETFGTAFRRPLTLLRAYLVEVARASRRQIRFAPCCACRMTLDEARLVGVLATIAETPGSAARHLTLLCNSQEIDAPSQVAGLFAETLVGLGRPLEF